MKSHMKSTERKKIIKHSISSDISFPVVVNMKRNLMSSPEYIWGLQSYKLTLRRVGYFKTDSRAKLSPIFQNLFFRKFSFDS